jgi:hypothetical protein
MAPLRIVRSATEECLPDLLSTEQIAPFARHCDLAEGQDVSAIGDLERLLGILLDK